MREVGVGELGVGTQVNPGCLVKSQNVHGSAFNKQGKLFMCFYCHGI